MQPPKTALFGSGKEAGLRAAFAAQMNKA